MFLYTSTSSSLEQSRQSFHFWMCRPQSIQWKKGQGKRPSKIGFAIKVYHSDPKELDSLFMQKQDIVRQNKIAVFERINNNYTLFDQWTQQNISFVIHLKYNIKKRFIEEKRLNRENIGWSVNDAKPAFFLYKDNGKGTGQITMLYKKRWQAELL